MVFEFFLLAIEQNLRKKISQLRTMSLERESHIGFNEKVIQLINIACFSNKHSYSA